MTAPATIDSQDLSERLSSATPPRVIDVRTPGEFETAHIAGAYNVPLDLLREHRDEIISHLDEDVVLVCRSGQRASQAEETLRTAGLGNVHILHLAVGVARAALTVIAGGLYLARNRNGFGPLRRIIPGHGAPAATG